MLVVYLRNKYQISPGAEFKYSGCTKFTVDLVMWHVVGFNAWSFHVLYRTNHMTSDFKVKTVKSLHLIATDPSQSNAKLITSIL